MEDQQAHIDSLLQRYLLLLDEYTRLRTQLSTLQASVFRDIARANFSAERGLRYGQDHYDDRMQALRTVRIEMKEEGLPLYEVVGETSSTESNNKAAEDEAANTEKEADANEKEAETEEKEAKEEEQASDKKKPVIKDPLRWFGLLTPQTLRSAQASSIEAVSSIIPRLTTLDREMAQVEIEVRRARKRKAKAQTAAGRETVATASEITAA